jgi:uncharacterized membrane protein YfcA
MDIGLWIYPVAIVGGFAAGFINTLAGNGSTITLTILMEFMGLPPNVANGSNRVGILSQMMVSTWIFHKEGKIDWKGHWPLVLAMFLGGMAGLVLALTVTNEGFRNVYGGLLILMLFVVVIRPKRWIHPPTDRPVTSLWLMVPVFFLLGIYGGFIQMGMGIFFLAFTVLVGRMTLVRANALKLICVGAYTVIVLIFFAYYGMVDWKAGGLLAIGQVIGGWICSRFAATHPLANVVAHRVLVGVVIFAIVKIFFWS